MNQRIKISFTNKKGEPVELDMDLDKVAAVIGVMVADVFTLPILERMNARIKKPVTKKQK